MSYDDGSLGRGDDAGPAADGDRPGATGVVASAVAALRGLFERVQTNSEEWPRLYVNQQVEVYGGQVEPVGMPLATIERRDETADEATGAGEADEDGAVSDARRPE